VYRIAKKAILVKKLTMGEISIKINIADRVYPLKINMEEEEVIRKATKLINDRIKEYQDVYAVRDKQDLLSMCALHYATINAEKNVVKENEHLADGLFKLDQLLTDFFSK
jgi:cell division protein ZapA